MKVYVTKEFWLDNDDIAEIVKDYGYFYEELETDEDIENRVGEFIEGNYTEQKITVSIYKKLKPLLEESKKLFE